MKYRVVYPSEGLLSGHEAGDVVTITDAHDAAHLQGLGLIEPVKEGEKKPAAEKKTTK